MTISTRALDSEVREAGFSFVEILTMCPTGWFIETAEAPRYLEGNLAAVHEPGVLKDILAS
jgi:2-oxoglutarate ferredoxin oxidoreductase subunit beta